MFFITLLLLSLSPVALAQVINLRPHQGDQHYHFGRVTIRPAEGRQVNDNIPLPKPPERHLARPGNVIVHFDREHEIQQLQYVLQDGRLATLYQRHPQHPSNSRMPQQIPSSIEVPSVMHRRDETGPEVKETVATTAAPPTEQANKEAAKENAKQAPNTKTRPPILIDPNSTIEILDSKMNSVSKLIGDHLTIAIPEEALEGAGSTGADESEDERLDVLATVAVDAMAHVGEEKLRKAGILVDKIKSKVAAKLRDLPSLIEAKLRAKSSAGQAYLDQQGHLIRVISEAHPTAASGGEEPNRKHIDNRRLVPLAANQQGQPMQLSQQRLVGV